MIVFSNFHSYRVLNTSPYNLNKINSIFRPAYQDELEELEAELKTLYDDYTVKFRNFVYLESLLEEYRKETPQKQNFVNITSINGPTIGGINQLEVSSAVN